MTRTNSDNNITAFKRAQLRHRRQGGDPNRNDDDLLDFSCSSQHNLIFSIDPSSSACSSEKYYEGPLYGVKGFPGFLYAPQALSPSLQLDLAYSAVSQYCEAPHATNIDLIPPKSGKEESNIGQSMWQLWKQENGFSDRWDDSSTEPPVALKKYRSFSKLSWSTMGYQYDWTARAYHEGAKSPVPTLLQDLASLFASTALTLIDETDCTNFTASACIVNYYHTKSIMGGHCDDLELALDKPVISVSLGLPAVFLLGGKTRDDAPVLPILVRPGDVMILGGASRLCYHGMARVIPSTVTLTHSIRNDLVAPQPFLLTRESVLSKGGGSSMSTEPDISALDRKALEEYLSRHRININVRQVLPDGMDTLPTVTDGQDKK